MNYYKYTTIDTAILILENESLKATNPNDFNDPFDSNILPEKPSIDINKIINIILKHKYHNRTSRRKVINNKSLIPKVLLEDKNEYISNIEDSFSVLNNDWSQYINNFRILCMTQDRSNILMWSHYADNHEGVLLGFKHTSGFVSNIKKVQYSISNAIPNKLLKKLFKKLYSELENMEGNDIQSFIADYFTLKNRDEKKIINIFNIFFTVKNKVWKYENEFRLIKLSNEEPDFISFNNKDLDEIILGVNFIKSIKKNKELLKKIIALLENKYKDTKIYKAEKKLNNLIYIRISIKELKGFY